MINKEHFTNGLIQVAIVLSLLRTDLDIYLVPPEVHLTGYSVSHRHQHETVFDSVVDYSRNDQFGPWTGNANLKSIDDDHSWSLSSLLSDLHSLAHYRRFDGISTSIHTWLVSDTGSARPAVCSIPTVTGNSDLATGTNHEIIQPAFSPIQPSLPAASSAEPAMAAGSSSSPVSFPDSGGELTKEDMELINILYLQDIDLGVGREAFDGGCQIQETNSDGPSTKHLKELDQDQCGSSNNNHQDYQQTSDGFPQLNFSDHCVIDNETGELMFVSSPNALVNELQYSQPLMEPQFNAVTLNMPDTPQIEFQGPQLTAQTAGAAALQQPAASYERLSHLDQRWSDIFSVINVPAPTPAVADYNTLSTVFGEQATASAVIQNASMSSAAAASAFNESFDISADCSVPMSSIFSNYSNDLDNLTMSLFTNNINTAPALPAQDFNVVQNDMFDTDHIAAEIFGNLSLVFPIEASGDARANFSQNGSNFDFFNGLNGNGLNGFQPNLLGNNQPAAAAASALSSVSDVNVDSPPRFLQPNHDFLLDPNESNDLNQFARELFGNFSLVIPVDTCNGTSMNFNQSSSVDILSDMLCNQTVDQSAAAAVISSSMNNIDSDNPSLLQHILQSNLAMNINVMDEDEIMENNTGNVLHGDGWTSDSAVSSMNSPQNMGSVVTDFDSASANESGAVGGLPKYATFVSKGGFADLESFESSSFSFLSEQEFDSASNFTEMPSVGAGSTKNVFHNHTYHLPQGKKSREELEEEARREKEERATRSRDEKRAKALKIPMTMEQIIESSVEEFTEMLTQYRLNEAQQQLARDIRRRGKNKMAAQNCRKRKMEVIQTIEEQVTALRDRRDALRRERGELDRNAAALKDKFKRLESELFRRLRDESGREYDPSLYSLLQTEDGGLFIVPRTNATGDYSAVSDKPHDEKSGRKRKSKRKD